MLECATPTSMISRDAYPTDQSLGQIKKPCSPHFSSCESWFKHGGSGESLRTRHCVNAVQIGGDVGMKMNNNT